MGIEASRFSHPRFVTAYDYNLRTRLLCALSEEYPESLWPQKSRKYATFNQGGGRNFNGHCYKGGHILETGHLRHYNFNVQNLTKKVSWSSPVPFEHSLDISWTSLLNNLQPFGESNDSRYRPVPPCYIHWSLLLLLPPEFQNLGRKGILEIGM